jgi:hypothetical protein
MINSPLPSFPAIDLQPVMRSAYGVLLFLTLAATLPQARRFFLSERWGGYAESTRRVDAIQNPMVLPVLLGVWLACALLLALGRFVLLAAVINLLLCRYFFVSMRWRGVLRGMGAPGFMTYWLGAAVCFREFARARAPQLESLTVLTFQVDFALIMLSAGIYKLTAGYASNNGMELGLSNPQWGYWWRAYARVPPANPVFRAMNHLAWSTEVVAGILMLIPGTRILGAALIILSFIFIATQIRLLFLCEMVIVSALLFFGESPATAGAGGLHADAVVVGALLWAYLLLLPFAHAGLFYNFYGRRALPSRLQKLLESYTNFFGIIIWRVFSADHTNFCVFIHEAALSGERRRTLTRYGSMRAPRFAHVGESITVTSLFTTLKYYPGNPALFDSRLLRYARTLPCADDALLVFEYLSVVKEPDGFTLVPVSEFLVNPRQGTVEEHRLNDSTSTRAVLAASPIHEGARPGTYAPSAS